MIICTNFWIRRVVKLGIEKVKRPIIWNRGSRKFFILPPFDIQQFKFHSNKILHILLYYYSWSVLAFCEISWFWELSRWYFVTFKVARIKNKKICQKHYHLSLKPLREESCPVLISWGRPYVRFYSWRRKIGLS